MSAEPIAPPWEEPVAGARAVTEWKDDGQPMAPFGPGGPAWSSPQELLSAMAGAFSSAMPDSRAVGRVVDRNISGTVTGGIRIELPERDGNVIAVDFRVDMRDDGGSWFVTALSSRAHCAVPLVQGDCR